MRRKKEILIDGNDTKSTPKRKPRTIAEALGLNRENIYNTDNLQRYERYLTGLNIAELHQHGLDVAGLRPNADRDRMITELLKAFENYWYQVNNPYSEPEVNTTSKKKAERARQVFSRR